MISATMSLTEILLASLLAVISYNVGYRDWETESEKGLEIVERRSDWSLSCAAGS